MTNPDRKKLVRILVLVAIVDLLIGAGILIWWFNRPQEARNEDDRLAASVINLSAAVDAYFSSADAAAPTGSDEEILRQAAAHDPSLLTAVFKPYRIRVQRQESYAVLLLCTEDGKQAVMEDAGCSARLDRRAEKGEPCEFTLKVGAGCKVTQQ